MLLADFVIWRLADIVCVLLGIFQPHIVYLLCLATPVDIVLLGVSFLEPADASKSSCFVDTLLSVYFVVSGNGGDVCIIAEENNSSICVIQMH